MQPNSSNRPSSVPAVPLRVRSVTPPAPVQSLLQISVTPVSLVALRSRSETLRVCVLRGKEETTRTTPRVVTVTLSAARASVQEMPRPVRRVATLTQHCLRTPSLGVVYVGRDSCTACLPAHLVPGSVPTVSVLMRLTVCRPVKSPSSTSFPIYTVSSFLTWQKHMV